MFFYSEAYGLRVVLSCGLLAYTKWDLGQDLLRSHLPRHAWPPDIVYTRTYMLCTDYIRACMYVCTYIHSYAEARLG